MAVSGSFDFTLNRDEIIDAALRKINAGGTYDDSVTTAQYTDHAETLNIMLKAWAADGMPISFKSVKEVGLVAGDADYGMHPNVAPWNVTTPERVNAVWLEDSDDNVTPLERLSREEYFELSNRTTAGTPTSWYYHQGDTTGAGSIMYLWPVPEAADVTEYALRYDADLPADDMDASADSLAFPQEWIEAIVYGLAARLAPEYGLPLALRQQLVSEASSIYQRALSSSIEDTSIFFNPDTSRIGC